MFIKMIILLKLYDVAGNRFLLCIYLLKHTFFFMPKLFDLIWHVHLTLACSRIQAGLLLYVNQMYFPLKTLSIVIKLCLAYSELKLRGLNKENFKRPHLHNNT